MRKHLLLIVCIVLSMPVFAQRNTNDYQFYLSEVVSNDGYESTVYTYNSNYQVATVVETPYLYDMTTDTMIYNELNQLVRITTYQLMNDEWRNVFYVDYTYNDRGLRETRKNYNNFGGTFELGGTYTYFYDDNENQSGWELDFMGGLYQKCERSFDENNNCLQEMGYNYMSGSQVNEWRIDYEYDNQGNMKSEYFYYWNNGIWEEYSRAFYTYDDNGNCTLFETYTGSMVTEKHEYTFDATSADVVVFPHDPEVEWSIFDIANNAPLIDKYYTVDTEYQLQYICDYIYNYEKLTTDVNENSVTTVICPNPAEDRFMIKNDKVDRVEIYDLTGKIMFASTISGELVIDVTDFISGIYVVKMSKGQDVDVVKLVVK